MADNDSDFFGSGTFEIKARKNQEMRIGEEGQG